MTDLTIRGSKGSESAHSPVESPDSLINTSYANILDAISEGPIVGLVNGAQSIYLDQTPLQNADGSYNFTGVTWEQRTGEHDQEHISGFPAVESEHGVGIELKAAQAWTQAFSNLELSAVRVRLGASSLFEQNEDGDTHGYTVAYVVELATDGSDYKVVVDSAFTGKTTSGYQRSHRIDLPKAEQGWSLRVRRTTPDSAEAKIGDTTSVVSYTEIIDAKLQYPYTALAGLKLDASQFSSTPERAYRVKLRIVQVPSNYDVATRSYSGTWDGTFKLAWTDNPAWIYRDLVLNDRYGFGRYISPSQVDKWALYQIAQYSDQMVDDGKGGKEPRFTCNLYLQARANGLQVLQDLASIFRGMSYYAGSEVVCSADMPSDPVYTYTNANVIDGLFNRPGSSGSTRFSVCKVSWTDRENFGAQRVEYVPFPDAIRRYGIRETELTAFGCVSQGQAQRLGLYTLMTNHLETGTVQFSVGLDGVMARPGQIVRVADQNYVGKPIGGRVRASTLDSVTVDDDLTVAAGDTLVIIQPNGVAQTRVIASVAGRLINVTEDFSAAPVVDSVYTVETAEVVAETYRILSVTESFGDDKLQYDIVAVQHNASKFAAIDSGAQIVIPPTSTLPNAAQAMPANVALSTFDSVRQGINVATMRITWEAAQGAQSYNVWWRRNSGDWVYAGVTYTTAIEVQGIYSGTYTARVSAVGVTGNASLWAYSNPTDLAGKTGEPPALASLTATPGPWKITLDWAFPAGAEDAGYTEIQRAESVDGSNASTLGLLAYPTNTYTLSGLAAGVTVFFRGRLIDRTGNAGPWNDWVMGQASADAGEYLELITEEFVKSALGEELLSDIDLITGTGPGSVNDRIEEAKTELGGQIDDVNTTVEGVRKDLADQVKDVGKVRSELAGQVTAINSSISSTKSELQSQITGVNNTLTSVKSDLQGQVTSVGAAVAKVRTDLQPQIDAVNALAGSLPYKAASTYSAGQSVLGGDKIIYQAVQNVPANTPPPNATYWLNVGQAAAGVGALATRVQTVETKVTNLEGTTTSQAQQITGLQSAVAGKADSSALQSLTTRVTTSEGKNNSQDAAITSQAQAITNLQTTVGGKADASALQSLTTRVTAAEGVNTSQGSAITNLENSVNSSTAGLATKASASTVQALSNTVTAQGNALTALGESVTNIDVNLSNAGSENLIFNPSFEKVRTDFAGLGLGWRLGIPAGTTAAATQVTSSLDPKGLAQRLDVTGIAPSGTYIDLGIHSSYLPSVGAGQVYTASSYVRGTPGMTARVFFQFKNAAGQTIQTMGPTALTVTDAWQRISRTSLPAPDGTVAVDLLFRINGDPSSGFVEWDRTQLEAGNIATGWRDNTGVVGADVVANAQATTALSGRVTTAEGSITAQAQQITNLTTTLSGKADASAVSGLSTRVTTAEGKITSQGTAITALENSVNSPTAGLATKASASTVQSLSNAVTAQGNQLTALGQSITTIDANLSNIGGGNFLFNPSFDTPDVTGLVASGWNVASTAGMSHVSSLVTSGIDNTGKAQRFDFTGAQSQQYVDVTTIPARRPGASQGATFTLSTYIRATTGAVAQLFLQVVNAAGAVVQTYSTGNLAADGKWQRILLVAADLPADAASLLPRIRVRTLSGSLNGFAEVDRAQLEIGAQMSGWQDNTLMLGEATDANANATQALSGRVTTAEGTISSQGSAITSLNSAVNSPTAGLATKATTSALNSLTTRVTATETALTSQGQSITSLTSSLGDIGSENLIANPSFEKESSRFAGLAESWAVGAAGSSTVTWSLIKSSLEPTGKAQRFELAGLTNGGNYVDIAPNPVAPASPGQFLVASIYFKATAGLVVRFYLQPRSSNNVTIVTYNGPALVATGEWQRMAFASLAMPTNTEGLNVLCRVGGSTANAASGYIEYDRAQLELGSVASGWRDNNANVNADQAALATALSSLTTTVTSQGQAISAQAQSITSLQTTVGNKADTTALNSLATRVTTAEGKITSQGTAITNLESTVNSPTAGLATKATAAAVNTLTTRVTATETALTTQSQAITDLKASVGSGDFVAGVTWEFADSVRNWYANASGSTIVAGPAFATVTGGTNLQVTSNTFGKVSGAQNPYVRFRFRRKGSTRNSCRLYWADETGGLAEARTFVYSISTATEDWQEIELDLSNTASWTSKTGIYGIRLDLVNSADTGAVVDMAYVALGRKSAAASGQALDTLTTTVTAQGNALTSQSQQITSLTSAVAGKADTSALSSLGTRVTTAEGKIESQAQQITNLTTTVSGKADTSAVNALTTRVTTAEGAITSQSTQLTNLRASMSEVGGENLIFNPSFEVAGNVAGIADGWRVGFASVTGTYSLVDSTLDPKGKCQRFDLNGLTSSGTYCDLALNSARFASCSPGQILTASAYVRGVVGFGAALYFQFKNAAGSTIQTMGPTTLVLGSDWQRISRTSQAAPAGTVAVDILLRTFGLASGASSGAVFWDRAQLEQGDLLTGWHDNSQLTAADQAVTASAVGSLSATVTSQRGTINSVSTRTTALENTVNSTANGLATKASASALDTLANRVTATETGVSSQASRITSLETSVNSTASGLATKASASALSSLTSTVTEQGKTLAADSTRIDGLTTSVGNTNTAIQSEATARANADTALGKRIDTVQSTAGTASASAQTAMNTAAAVDGKVSSSIVNKVQITQNGIRYNAGYALGVDYSGGTVQTSFVVSANQFMILNDNASNGSIFSPFAVTNGQVFMNQAFIKDGSIDNAKIGDVIYSSNYIAGRQGWILRKDGIFEINSTIPGAGRVILNANGLNVFDENGVLRVQLGNLG